MRSITTLPSINGKRVLIRVDYNVPLKGNRVLDPRRIESSYKTIDTVLKKGGIPILLAHLGDGEPTLKPIARFLNRRYKVLFLSDGLDIKVASEAIANAKKGSVVLLENIRRNAGEEKNSREFSKLIALLGDYYINDAFSVSHRVHASVVGIPKLLPSFAGFQLIEEVVTLEEVFTMAKHPFVFILGGAKFGTKIPLIETFSKRADSIIIAGAILNNFYKVAGFEVGKSVVEEGYEAVIKKLLKNPNLLLPTDLLVQRGTQTLSLSPTEVQSKDKIVDIGKESAEQISKKIAKAKLVVWNGPTGWYEAGFTKGTIALAKALRTSKAKTIVGGGDTAAVIEKVFSVTKTKRVFISTGGGATLEYLANRTLPGITVLAEK